MRGSQAVKSWNVLVCAHRSCRHYEKILKLRCLISSLPLDTSGRCSVCFMSVERCSYAPFLCAAVTVTCVTVLDTESSSYSPLLLSFSELLDMSLERDDLLEKNQRLQKQVHAHMGAVCNRYASCGLTPIDMTIIRF